jgi:hypothetical protein
MSISEIERVAMGFGDDLSNSFYFTVQSYIGQNDGGFADMFEGDGVFKNGIGREILITLAAISGNDEFDRKGDYIWKRRLPDLIEPRANDPADLTTEQIAEIGFRAALHLLHNLERAFQVNHMTLVNRFFLPLTAEVESYMKAEMEFAQASAPTI